MQYRVINENELVKDNSKRKRILWSKNIGKRLIVEFNNKQESLEICGYDKNKRELYVSHNSIIYSINITSAKTNHFDSIFNKITYTHPQYIKFFVGGKNEAKKYSYGCNRKVLMRCPDCGKQRKYDVQHLIRFGYMPCECRKLGISFPERIMFGVLSQLDVEFLREVRFDWMKFEKLDGSNTFGISDFVIEQDKLIIEMDGAFHFRDCVNNKCSLDERIHSDNMKDNLSLINGYTTIRIKSDISDFDYIKNNIISRLNDIYNLNNINWDIIKEYAQSNLVQNVCMYKNINKEITTTELAKKFNISTSLVRTMLKTGNDLGWCEYNPLIEIEKKNERIKDILKERNQNNAKPVYQYYINGLFRKEFVLISDAAKEIGVTQSSLYIALKNNYICGGYRWSLEKKDNIGNYENERLEKTIMFDLKTGEVLGTFKSRKEASDCTGIPSNLIINCCIGKTKSAYGYGFKNDDGNPIILNNYKHKTTGKKVCIKKDGVICGIYDSAHELERRSVEDFGILLSFKGISSVASGKRELYKGFGFEYIIGNSLTA